VYRRFLRPNASEAHHVFVARVASVVVLVLAGVFASMSVSLRALFEFFLAFLAGVGPIYVLRWLWWRVRASTEIAAMLTSAVTSTLVTWLDGPGAPFDVVWRLGPLSPGGDLGHEGRLVVVAAASLAVALAAIVLAPRTDPDALVEFYRRVRPIGWWGPVRARARIGGVSGELGPALLGSAGALALTFGLMFGLGFVFLERPVALAVSAAATLVGTLVTGWALRRLAPRASASALNAARADR